MRDDEIAKVKAKKAENLAKLAGGDADALAAEVISFGNQLDEANQVINLLSEALDDLTIRVGALENPQKGVGNGTD